MMAMVRNPALAGQKQVLMLAVNDELLEEDGDVNAHVRVCRVSLFLIMDESDLHVPVPCTWTRDMFDRCPLPMDAVKSLLL